jgi:predicted acetyltransferase
MRQLANQEISLHLVRDMPADPSRQWLRALRYQIRAGQKAVAVGQIELRLGYSTNVVLYGGHIGYAVDPPFRGNHYAAEACLLLKQVAIAHHMDVLWITCNPDNWPSRKTCEYIGAMLVEIIDLPPENDMYREGERQKCRYRWILY